MKRLTVCIAVALACLGLHVAMAQNVLKNESIIKMVSDKQGDDLILLMIQNQPCDFSMTADDLKKLKDQGVSDKVLAAMITKNSAKADEKLLGKGTGPMSDMRPSVISTGSNSTDPNDPMSPHKQGIWLYVENKMTPLPSAAMKEMKTSSMIPSMVNPFHKIQEKMAFIGPRSDLRASANPTFYFYGYDDMRKVSLATLEQKKDTRELTTGAIGLTSTSTTNGVSDKAVVHFHSEQISNNVYKVTLDSPLKPGESALSVRWRRLRHLILVWIGEPETKQIGKATGDKVATNVRRQMPEPYRCR